MPIIHIKGPKNSGKSLLANSLRNTQIAKGLGALLIDDTQDGEARYLLEKIVYKDSLGEMAGAGPAKSKPAKDIPWKGWAKGFAKQESENETKFIKQDPLIVFVGDKISLLAEFEEIAPGFTELFGPVRSMELV